MHVWIKLSLSLSLFLSLSLSHTHTHAQFIAEEAALEPVHDPPFYLPLQVQVWPEHQVLAARGAGPDQAYARLKQLLQICAAHGPRLLQALGAICAGALDVGHLGMHQPV